MVPSVSYITANIYCKSRNIPDCGNFWGTKYVMNKGAISVIRPEENIWLDREQSQRPTFLYACAKQVMSYHLI